MQIVRREPGDQLPDQSAMNPLANATPQNIEQFLAMLNEEPPANEISINKLAENSKYQPIGIIQMQLDKFFMGLWHTENFRTKVIANEIVGEVDLVFFHPVAKIWMRRQGAASVMIGQKSKSEITDMAAKIKNTLTKDYPHLLASCITSAAKTLGKRFGRDLNRKVEDNYERFYTEIGTAEEALSSIEWDKIVTLENLKSVWDSNPNLHDNSHFKKQFSFYKAKLKKPCAA
jgi:hypothetical protein